MEWSSWLEMLELLERRLMKEVRREKLDEWLKEEDTRDMLLKEPVFFRDSMPLYLLLPVKRSLGETPNCVRT